MKKSLFLHVFCHFLIQGMTDAEDKGKSIFQQYSYGVPLQGEYCMPGQVSVQSDEGPYTLISMQVRAQ